MRAWILAVVGVAALVSLPAHAARYWHPRPIVTFGYGYYPWGYPWYSPWWGPPVGVGVYVDRSRPPPSAQQGAPQTQALKLYVYPSAGQTEQQMSEDRYQCHVWAVDQSGYDPTLGTRGRADADGYTRAFTACMQGRNYVVR
jgi:hypothetical protein